MRSTVALMLLLVGCLAAAAIVQHRAETSSASVHVSAPPRVDTRAEALRRIEPELKRADVESEQAITRLLDSVHEFFGEVKKHTPQFSEAVLGWGSKWRFVADKMPFTRGDRHQEYLREAFATHLFSDKDLTRLFEQVTGSYADTLTGIENEMLVRIREDLEDLPITQTPAMTDAAAFQAAYQTALTAAMNHVGSEVQADVAGFVLSVVVQEVMTQVAVRLGVSAGILGAGAGSSWATFGIGLVIGLVVDQVISWVWDWWADPHGELTRELNTKLDDLERLLIEGDKDLPGLRSRLGQFARDRSRVRREAVSELVKSVTDTNP